VTEFRPDRPSAAGGPRKWAGLFAATALAACLAEAWAAPSAITIDGMRFQPETLTVRKGERVTWVNKDLVPHTVTHKQFDSATIEPDGSWTFIANKPGTYHYVCAFHPVMKATLIVKDK
jgi:plastocyanin